MTDLTDRTNTYDRFEDFAVPLAERGLDTSVLNPAARDWVVAQWPHGAYNPAQDCDSHGRTWEQGGGPTMDRIAYTLLGLGACAPDADLPPAATHLLLAILSTPDTPDSPVAERLQRLALLAQTAQGLAESTEDLEQAGYIPVLARLSDDDGYQDLLLGWAATHPDDQAAHTAAHRAARPARNAGCQLSLTRLRDGACWELDIPPHELPND